MTDLSGLERGAREYLLGRAFCGSIGMENLFAPLPDEKRSEPPVMACHVMLTAPQHALHGELPFSMPEHEQWVARLSALAWRRYNGPIHLFTDREGGAYFRDIGLDAVYDAVHDDLRDLYGLDQKKFWASGKLLALERLRAPCLILDMDLIVWGRLPLQGAALAAAHTEHLNDEFYPGTEYFLMSPRYRFPEDWDFSAEPLNTAILYLGDDALRREYLSESFRFMRYERDTPDNGSNCMIFAEQRILAMCAARRGIRARTFLDYDDLLRPQRTITHTWSGKRVLNLHPEAAAAVIASCREKCAVLERELTLNDLTQ